MSDDLDDLLRRSMKTLDEQVPSGYFEALPNRTLARLEENSMQLGQTTGEGTEGSKMSTGVPPQADRDEDSGLHDIRSLASSTKLRLSSRRSTQNPLPVDDEVLASSSAGWKVVALPEPAKMVSLPELAELPPVRDIKEQAKESKRAAQEARKAEKAAAAAAAAAEAKAAAAAPVAATPVAAVEARTVSTPAVEPAAPVIGARFAQQKKSKAPLVAVIGLGLAAAAGGVFYVTTQNKDQDTQAPDVVASGAREERAKAAAPAEPPPPAQMPTATQAIATDDADAAAGAPAAEPLAVTAANEVTEKAPAKADRRSKGKAIDKQPETEGEVKKAEPKDKPPKPDKNEIKTGGGEGEPSFDQLLKEAGVDTTKKVAKPKLDKTQLTTDDIRKGMGALTTKAKACYAGTEGRADVRLTVAPSGEVQKVTVTGVFKGTPVAKCIEAAVRSATFPPWDGGPQSFGYTYLLSE